MRILVMAAIIAGLLGTSIGAHAASVESLRGKTCTSSLGNKFTFFRNGRYTYRNPSTGFKETGQYALGDGVYTVHFSNGVRRTFSVSHGGGNVYYVNGYRSVCGK